MSERRPLKQRMTRAEVQPELHSLDDSICDKLCSYLKYAVCIGASLLIVYLLFSFIGGINGVDYLPKINVKTFDKNEELISHEVGSDPFTSWEECDVSGNEPSVLAYHIHAVFDGNDENSIDVAMNAFYAFMEQFDSNMEQCSFSHSNGATFQTKLCYFPRNFEDDDFPMASNKIFQSTNYAFYVPKSYLQETMSWWMQHHSKTIENDETITFDYVIHPVTGCQTNDHTKWLVNSLGYEYQLVKENLLCCHNGPSACSCDIATYKIVSNNIDNDIDASEQCLTVSFDETGDSGFFTMEACEEWTSRGLGSWREVTYSNDEMKQWFQIENYGDLTEPMYMCLAVDVSDSEIVEIGSKVVLNDCSLNQNIEENEWISNESKFKWNENKKQILFVGKSESEMELCLNVNTNNQDEEESSNTLSLTLEACIGATMFERDFTP